jgi:hypothetical protein
MTGFIAHLYNLLLHFTNHCMTHYVSSSPSPSTADSRDSLNCISQSQSNFPTGGLPQSVRLGDKPLETHDCRFFQLNTCCFSPYVTSSLTRGWVCHLQLLPGFASAVILRSEYSGTHNHILLSQFRESANLEGQAPIFISPRNTVTQLYPQALGSLFIISYDWQGYGGGYSTPPPRGVIISVA